MPRAAFVFDIPFSPPESPPMLDLATATRGQFEPCIGQAFELIATDGHIALTLAEVRPLGAARPSAGREPFALTFRGTPAQRIPQRIHRLEHAALGAMEIFLVQIGADAGASHFEAIFS